MQCKCGFENAADARFCGNCRSALGDVPAVAVPPAAAPLAEPPVAPVGKAPARPLSTLQVAIAAAVVAVLAVGYWWMNRPAERYKLDNGGLYRIAVNGKFGFMDRSGKTVITPQFDAAEDFSEGLAQVRVGAKSGYINTKGVVAITPQFDEASPFRYGRAGVKLGNRFGFIDKDGKYIGNPDFSWAGQFSGDLAAVRTAEGVMAFVNRSGKLELAGKFQQLRGTGFNQGLAPAGSGGKWGFIDETGKWVIDPQFENAFSFADGLAQVAVGGRWGYIDRKGKFVVNPQYDFADEFYEGLADFRSGNKSGFIDTKGRVAIEAKFLYAFHFSEGLAQVQTEDGWGFIDRTGKMVVSPQFDSTDVFQNGLARVTALGKEAYITTTGAFVVNPFPGTTVSAEKARRAAEAAQARETNRSRVEQGIAGEWAGRFNNDPLARLSITSGGGVINATLLSGGWRETFHCELLPDGTLVLTGTGANRVGPSSFGTYSLDTMRLELDTNRVNFRGQYHDSQGHSGSVVFAKLSL